MLCALATSALASLTFPTSVAHADASTRTSPEDDLATALDVRVRMRAALVLGKKHGDAPRLALEKALDDQAWVVRVAAAAALGAMGDPASLPAIDARQVIETEPAAKSELDRARDALTTSPAAMAKVRWVLKLGSMKDRRPSGETTAKGATPSGGWSDTLSRAMHTRAAATPGAMVVDDVDPALAARLSASSRHIPIVQMDGVLVHLSQVPVGRQIGFRAEVELAVRKLPEQTLKGSMSGNATSVDDASALGNADRVNSLQRDALGAAVDSAMKNAERALVAAGK